MGNPSVSLWKESMALKRGDVLSGDNDARVTVKEFDANLFWFYGEYNKGDKIQIKCTTQESYCTLSITEKFDPATMDKKTEGLDHLEIGDIAKAKVKLRKRIAIDLSPTYPRWGGLSWKRMEYQWVGGSSYKHETRRGHLTQLVLLHFPHPQFQQAVALG